MLVMKLSGLRVAAEVLHEQTQLKRAIPRPRSPSLYPSIADRDCRISHDDVDHAAIRHVEDLLGLVAADVLLSAFACQRLRFGVVLGDVRRDDDAITYLAVDLHH